MSWFESQAFQASSLSNDPFLVETVIKTHEKMRREEGRRLRARLADQREMRARWKREVNLSQILAQNYLTIVREKIRDMSAGLNGEDVLSGRNIQEHGDIDRRLRLFHSTDSCQVIHVSDWVKGKKAMDVTERLVASPTASSFRRMNSKKGSRLSSLSPTGGRKGGDASSSCDIPNLKIGSSPVEESTASIKLPTTQQSQLPSNSNAFLHPFPSGSQSARVPPSTKMKKEMVVSGLSSSVILTARSHLQRTKSKQQHGTLAQTREKKPNNNSSLFPSLSKNKMTDGNAERGTVSLLSSPPGGDPDSSSPNQERLPLSLIQQCEADFGQLTAGHSHWSLEEIQHYAPECAMELGDRTVFIFEFLRYIEKNQKGILEDEEQELGFEQFLEVIFDKVKKEEVHHAVGCHAKRFNWAYGLNSRVCENARRLWNRAVNCHVQSGSHPSSSGGGGPPGDPPLTSFQFSSVPWEVSGFLSSNNATGSSEIPRPGTRTPKQPPSRRSGDMMNRYGLKDVSDPNDHISLAVDHNCTISFQQFRDIVARSTETRWYDGEYQRLFELADSDGDGRLSKREFSIFLAGKAVQYHKGKGAFQVVTTQNNDGSSASLELPLKHIRRYI